MSLRDEWLADPEQLTYAEWTRRRSVPPGLLVLASPQVNAAERVKVERKPVAHKRKSRAKPGGRSRVHGSTHGWKRHREAGEDPCAVCVAGHEAEKARRAADKRAQRALKPRQPAQCGSPAKARKHRRDGEEVCEACRQAERDEWHNRKKKRPEQQEAAA